MNVGDKFLRRSNRGSSALRWVPVYVIGETRISWLVSEIEGVHVEHPAVKKIPKRAGVPVLWARDEAHAAELDARIARLVEIEKKLRCYSFRPTDDQLDAIAKIMGW